MKGTVSGEQHVLARAGLPPLDLVDLFLDFQAFQVVKLCLVALELCVEAVFGVLCG